MGYPLIHPQPGIITPTSIALFGFLINFVASLHALLYLPVQRHIISFFEFVGCTSTYRNISLMNRKKYAIFKN